jgi:hypothetical protein
MMLLIIILYIYLGHRDVAGHLCRLLHVHVRGKVGRSILH